MLADSLAEPLSALLANVVATQSSKPALPTIFDGNSRKAPTISLYAYIERIEKYSGCTKPVVVAALAYMDRLLLGNQSFSLTELNIHRVFWTCLVLSSKFFEDKFYTNDFYAKVGGVTLLEMNKLEVAMLDMLKFELFLSPEQYVLYDSVLTAAVSRFYNAQQQQVVRPSVAPVCYSAMPVATVCQ